MNYNIKISGFSHSKERQLKLLTFPDGVARLVNMERRYWEMLDWLAAHDGSGSTQETVQIAYQLATETFQPSDDSFERHLRDCLYHSITGGVRAVMEFREEMIQDNSAVQAK